MIVSNTADIESYKTYADSGRLKVRLYLMLYINTEAQANSMASSYRPPSAPRLTFGGWKLAMDGGNAAGTTLMYNKSLFASNLSYPYFSQDVFNRIVKVLHDTGLQVSVHVGGDQGIDMTLTAFEEAMKQNSRPDPRHRIEHGLFPLSTALNRMKAANIILSTQPQWISWHGDGIASTFDQESMNHFLPLKTILGMGIPMAFGCDVPASIYQEPKWAFYGAVNRRTDSGTVWNSQEKLTVQEVLRTHTIGSAYAGFAEKTTGSLEPGKYADIVVWSHDLYTMAPGDLNRLTAQMTIVNEEIVYDAGNVVGKSALELALPAGGAGAASSWGTGNNTQAGYATASLSSGTQPYGVAVFSFKQNGVVVSEAAVPASPPTTSARIFIDYRSGVPAMPGRSDAGSVDIDTRLAVVNRGSAAANMTYTLRNRAGGTITTGHGTVAGGGHFAKFIDQLKDVAPDFDIPRSFPTAVGFGSLDIASDQPVSVLALRLTMNQRNETLLTSTPVADLTKAPGNLPLYFPQFVDGGGYITTINLLNTSSAVETGRLSLFGDSGTPLVVNQVGGTRDSTFAYSIQPGGIFVFQTDGSPASANVGSVQLKPDVGTSSPIGAGVFSFMQRGARVTESGVPAAAPTTHARIYIDQSGNHGTGLAIASPGNSAICVTFKAYQTDGSTPAGSSGAPLVLDGNGHRARFVSELVSGLPANFTGVLDISSPSPFVALTLRSLKNSRDDFLLTTFPIADATQPAPAPIVFPQIADGGGYTTEFILLSAAGPAGATLNLFGEAGKPLAVGR